MLWNSYLSNDCIDSKSVIKICGVLQTSGYEKKERKKQGVFMWKRLRVTLVLSILFVITGFTAYRERMKRIDLVFAEAHEEVAVTVDGRELTLQDMAVYIVYQEKEVQQQALVYDSDNPNKYWNAYTNKYFIRSVAEDAVVNMAVHDEIFYQIAVEEGISLNEEEEAYLANEIMDFFMDLSEEQLERLGVEKSVLESSMRKIALANKYQSILAEMNGAEYTDYDYTGASYEIFASGHKVEVNENVWDRISVGRITVNY